MYPPTRAREGLTGLAGDRSVTVSAVVRLLFYFDQILRYGTVWYGSVLGLLTSARNSITYFYYYFNNNNNNRFIFGQDSWGDEAGRSGSMALN